MKIDTKEKLEEALSKVGIAGEWINPDEYGFSRLYKFNACGTEVIIEWYCNYSEIIIGSARMWFTHINIYIVAILSLENGLNSHSKEKNHYI